MTPSLTPQFSVGSINRQIDKFVADAEDSIIYMLTYVGETYVNEQRQIDTYKDQTSNLRSSLGYVIGYNGKIIQEDFTGKTEGVQAAREVAEELLNEFNNGYVLIVMAGMSYAAAVESKGFDVLTGGAPAAKDLLMSLIQDMGLK